MSIFRGIRQKLRGGADAGRGDQPYSAYKPNLAMTPKPGESRLRVGGRPYSEFTGWADNAAYLAKRRESLGE